MSDATNQALSGALTGGAVGAAGGLLTTLFRKDKSLRLAVKDALTGAGIGAAAGGAAGLVNGAGKPPEEPTASTPAVIQSTPQGPKRMSLPVAALVGPTLGVGAAIHGGQAGGAGQALRSGAASGGAALTAAMLTSILTKGKLGASSAAGALGGVVGSVVEADSFNKRHAEKKAMMQGIKDKISSATSAAGSQFDKATSGMRVAPMSNWGGASVGGVGGAALGGTAGLLKAIFDSEDDGIMSTLGKTISGAGVGGLAGAGLGAGASHLMRKNMMGRIPGIDRADDKERNVVEEALKRFVLPVGPTARRLTGTGSKEDFNKATGQANAGETLLHAIAPLLVASAGKRTQHMLDGSARSQG